MAETDLPKYRVIANDLLNKIQTGVYAQNTIIPPEVELASTYQVSRPTVRQAISLLVNQGYLERRRKRGTLVKKVKIEQEFTHLIESYSEEMSSKGIYPKTNLLYFGEEKANPEVSKNLQLEVQEPVFKMVRLRYANEQPTVLVTTYVPKKRVPKLADYDFSTASLYSTLEKYQLKVTHVIRKLEVMEADETTANLLNIAANKPIFYFHTQGLTSDEQPIEYSIAEYRGDINSFVIDVQR
ncbi:MULTISPECIES: GntR family transcriptional regulator [Lactobacillus]|uniref:GntR family transcriptional regulator n=1 Tax=Lactobacillus panisapium TaxID=2012495 RepID=A0ABX8W907_9LACO|nr:MULTISPECIES: GntR family transcriptional regulator [Lactobacillus]MCT6807270.1 GntR family transcriptional regulator [Bombilactobacillus sp.]MCO6532366.1 GntR family transcriptional regulator [Lactobacillus sp.]MCO6533734.1 GntR family transcriptional regulator [Lactobacillus sp.]MCO6535333.1 GntR family transcriptional regulator [Lactobacillus sp.]MCT6853722.1 GntR family transcriptional regulator [Lactobacillus panisapium]